MPGFVDRSEEALVEEVARDTRRDPDVTGTERSREGVRRDVLAAALEVVAQALDRLERIGDLQVGVEAAIEDAIVDRIRMTRDIGDKRHDRALQLGEDCLELGGLQAGLAAVEQRIVGAILIADRIGDATVQLDVFHEIRLEEAELLVASRLLPSGPRDGARARDLGDQVGGQLARFVVVAACDPDEAGFV